jgi:hypothetical protein
VADDKKEVAAYIPWKTLLTATDILEQGLPKQLDPSAFPTFSGSIRSWTLSAFRFLGFTDAAGVVQPRLREWVEDKDGRHGLMKAILLERYPAVITLAVESGTANQMKDAIAAMGVSGTTLGRAIAFFIGATKYADIPLPPTWEKTKFPITTKKRSSAKGTAKGGSEDDDQDDDFEDEPGVSGEQKTITLRGGGTLTLIASVNFLAMPKEDRRFVFEVIDKLDEYDSEPANTSAQVPTPTT